MQSLNAVYLTEIARQIGFISAFLGGVSATFMIGLLTLRDERKVIGWAVGCAAASAAVFVVAVVASTLLIMALHPEAPSNVANGYNLDRGRILTFLPFALGMYLLLACLGLAGWVRSPRAGRLTTVFAGTAVVAVSYLLAS